MTENNKKKIKSRHTKKQVFRNPKINEDIDNAKSPEALYNSLSKDKIKEINKRQKTLEHDFNKNLNKASFRFWQNKYYEKFKPASLYLIIMHLRNNRYDFFVVSTTEPFFLYNKGLYLLDSDLQRMDANSGLPILYYHQDISVPFKINISTTDLKKEVGKVDDNVEKALNPFNLKSFMTSETIEKILKGRELLNDIALMKKLVIVMLGMVGLLLVLVLRTMGYI